MACESRETFAIDFANSFLHLGLEKDVSRRFRNIDAVTPQMIRQVAQETFAPELMTTLVIR